MTRLVASDERELDPPAPQLSLLGGFRLFCGDTALALSPSAQRLVAYVALHRNRAVPRGVLAERLWAETDPQRAASSLRSALWRLPRPGRVPLMVTDGTCVQLAAHVVVDLWGAERRARDLAGGQVRPDQHDDTAELYDALRADLLPQWCDDWLLVEQESYRQLRLHALEALSDNLRSIGRYSAALMAGLAAVGSEPLRETAHRRVIEVHLAEDNAAEALRQYQVYRRLLADELGLRPSTALRSLVAPLLGRPVDRGEPVAQARSVGGGRV